jgi:hypothetical protein
VMPETRLVDLRTDGRRISGKRNRHVTWTAEFHAVLWLKMECKHCAETDRVSARMTGGTPGLLCVLGFGRPLAGVQTVVSEAATFRFYAPATAIVLMPVCQALCEGATPSRHLAIGLCKASAGAAAATTLN